MWRLHSILTAALLAAPLAALAPEAAAQGYGGTVADYLVRGDSLLQQKKPNEAIVQFQEARTLCPTQAEIVTSYIGEARARAALGEMLPAAGLFEEAAARFPDDPRVPDLLYNAGAARYKAGEIDRAIEVLRRALEAKPTPDLAPWVRLQLAQALRLRGRAADVLEVLKDFETEHPQSPLLPNALYSIAIANHDLGKLRESEERYRALIDRFKGSPAATEAHFELGWVLADQGRRREAADFYRQYVALAPSSPVAAAALERAGDLLLFRAPKQSLELYGLARVKAAANPAPPIADLGLGRWLPLKRSVAGALSRAWVVAILGVVLAGGVGLAGRAAWRWQRARAGRRGGPGEGEPGTAAA